MVWKGRLVTLFCKVLDVEDGRKFRKFGGVTSLHELFVKWSQKWAKRLARSKGQLLTEVDMCFEALLKKAAKEAAELKSLEEAFDAAQEAVDAAGRPAKAPRTTKPRREPPVGAAARAAPQEPRRERRSEELSRRAGGSRVVAKRAPSRRAGPSTVPRTPPAADEAAPST
jgi:hypothetical protein